VKYFIQVSLDLSVDDSSLNVACPDGKESGMSTFVLPLVVEVRLKLAILLFNTRDAP